MQKIKRNAIIRFASKKCGRQNILLGSIRLLRRQTLHRKNASCEALIWAFLSEKYNLNRLSVTIRFKLFYNGNIEQPNLQMIPKKYHKYFQLNNN